MPPKLIVGGSIEEEGKAFLDAWHKAERDEPVQDRTLTFESWDAIARVLTGRRYELLKHLRAHPSPSVSALARALGRQYRRVHADVAALEAIGLIERANGLMRPVADTIHADIRL